MVLTNEETAYLKLRDMIIRGDFPQGEFLSQRMLAQKTKTAVITVRNSLRKLENDGLIENIPKWGVRIPKDSIAKIKERYIIREVLELKAVELLRANYKTEYKKRLMRLADDCDEIFENAEVDYVLFASRHGLFHQEIARLAGNSYLEKFLNQLNLSTLMIYNANRVRDTEKPKNVHHHANYVNKILMDDEQKALEAVSDHISRGMTGELEVFMHQGHEDVSYAEAAN